MSETSIKEALKKGSLILQNQKEAAILLSHFLNNDRLYLITHEKEVLKDSQKYLQLIQRRKSGEPIEYITKSVSFYSKNFYIEKGALIPRPETELLIDHAKEVIEKNSINNIAEIGTGSGIISIMLALSFPTLQITATDINKEALKIAKINAKKFNVEKRIKYVHTSYLDSINQNFDMIVSNPPYIAKDFKLENSLSFEPQNALFGGEKGDEMLREIIDISIAKQIRYLVCEMGYDQKEPLEKYFCQKGVKEFFFYQDYSKFDRGFVAKMKE